MGLASGLYEQSSREATRAEWERGLAGDSEIQKQSKSATTGDHEDGQNSPIPHSPPYDAA